jgi:polar amino acid transport system permease protein
VVADNSRDVAPRRVLGRRSHAFLLAALAPPVGWVALRHYYQARGAERRKDRYEARRQLARAREWAWYTVSYLVLVAVVLGVVTLLTANGHAVLHTFFNGQVLRSSFPDVLRGFWLNVRMFVLAELLVLPWAFLVAAARTMPGAGGRPIRWLAVAYVDFFRGMPAVIVIYLTAFGLPIAGLPFLGGLSGFELCTMALVLVYGAYVSEVFRAGLQSVHWSQGAAARSLGLSHSQSLRYVVAPQAIRRIIPPLLNDFIGLQKDTSLVSFVGLLDAFNQSRIIASNSFNLSAVTGVGLVFVVITIPMARLVDALSARDARRTAAGEA